jgi:hypothetical protein
MLRERGEGETALTNPNIQVRRRFKKIYEDFRPGARGGVPVARAGRQQRG